MGLKKKFEDAWKEFASQKNKYWSDATQSGYGCSSGTCWCLRRAGIINYDEYFHAASGYEGVLGDRTRFEKIKFDKNKVQWMDILVSWGHHTATWAGDAYNSLWECAPEDTHSLATNGTGCGLHQGHGIYNCGTGTNTWDYIYRIIDQEDELIKKFSQETINIAIKRAEEIAKNDYHGYSNKVGSNLGADFGQRDYDCGAFVSDCYRHAGVLTSGTVLEPNQADGTWGYDKILTAAGFVKYPFNASAVKPGDVLIRHGAHTEMVYSTSPAKTIGAHNNYDGQPGDGYGNEVSIVNMASNWTYIYKLPVDSEPTEEHPRLQKGSTGEAVKELQRILNAKISAELDVDGSFGPLTLTAVKDFQKKNGIGQDGIVGPKTWAALLKEEPKPIIPTTVLTYGHRGDLVMTLQNLLNKKINAGLDIDGSFGPATMSALKLYQKTNGLEVDGYCGPLTWKSLYS